MSEIDCKAAHKASFENIGEVMGSEKCGCFHCLSVFDAGSVKDWADKGATALCPNCGVDSVIGDSSRHPIDKDFLVEMNKKYF